MRVGRETSPIGPPRTGPAVGAHRERSKWWQRWTPSRPAWTSIVRWPTFSIGQKLGQFQACIQAWPAVPVVSATLNQAAAAAVVMIMVAAAASRRGGNEDANDSNSRGDGGKKSVLVVTAIKEDLQSRSMAAALPRYLPRHFTRVVNVMNAK